jgi:hypothetical protein
MNCAKCICTKLTHKTDGKHLSLITRLTLTARALNLSLSVRDSINFSIVIPTMHKLQPTIVYCSVGTI